MTITPLYASLIAMVFIVLSVRVIRTRLTLQVGLGVGESALLKRRVRAHANCAEYAPIAVLLMLLAELQGAPSWSLHGLGGLLVSGRIIHALGLSREPEPPRLRTIGMLLTFTVLACGVLANLTLLSWARLF